MGLFEKFAKELPSVANKIFVITGTTSGTGYVAAQTAAEHGGEVVVLNRPSERAENSLKKLQAAVPEGKFVPIACDLQDFGSVRKASAEIKQKYDKIYCLANNAGIMATPDKATKDGYDTQMQTNHLSHFLLTANLFPLIIAGAKAHGDARIVQHSSGSRHMTANGKLEEKYLGPNGGNLGGDKEGSFFMNGPNHDRYAQTKLANSVFSYALYDKLQQKEEYKNIKAIAAHPGVAATALADHLDLGLFAFLVPILGFFLFQSAEDGAIGLVMGMMDPKAESGKLYGPKGLKGMATDNPPKKHEIDTNAKEMLWRTSEKATRTSFNI